MILGALVIIVVGTLVTNYLKGIDDGTTIPSIETEHSSSLPSEHTVVAGENLWSISEKYYDSGYNWVDIASANNLSTPDVIEVGQTINIPNVEKKTIKTNEKIKKTNPSEDHTSDNNTYIVKKGDTLWSIALDEYNDGYRWTSIANANNLSNPDVIHKGNVFTLPR